MGFAATKAVCAFTALVVGAACSNAEPVDPPQACRTFFDTWCNQNASCRPPSDRARYLEDCHFVNGLELDCSQTKAVGSSYDTCLANISSTSCDAYVEGMGLPFPPSCKGILVK